MIELRRIPLQRMLDWQRKQLIEALHDKGVLVGFRLALISPELAIPELESMLDDA